jgi:hypothetical protein
VREVSEIIKINMGNNTEIEDIEIFRGGRGKGNLYMHLTTGRNEKIIIKLPKEKFLKEAKGILKVEMKLD